MPHSTCAGVAGVPPCWAARSGSALHRTERQSFGMCRPAASWVSLQQQQPLLAARGVRDS